MLPGTGAALFSPAELAAGRSTVGSPARLALFMLPSFSLPPAGAPADTLLPDLLAVSLAPLLLLRPLATPEPPDFALDYLNPAAQRLVALPERPGTTMATQFPGVQGRAALAFCQQAYAAGAGGFELVLTGGRRLQVNARRSGTLLLLSALPDFQAEVEQGVATREAAAYAEANRQRAQLYHMLEQAPAMICVLEGPEHVFQFVNPPYQALVGARPLLGRPIAEALPELAGQPIFELLNAVYQTGETYFANEMLVQLDHANTGPRELDKRYYNFIYQARRNPAGSIDGIFVFAYEVTAQVLARQQAEVLNAELESRVAARAGEAEAARADAESQRVRLTQLIMQAPAVICVLDGPELVYQLVNPNYQQVFPGRMLLGRPLLDALPELRESAIPDLLAQVYATGESLVAHELPLQLARHEGGPLEERYWTFTYQARRDALNQIDGILVFAYEVTEQVRARQAIEISQHQTQALADELRRANVLLTRTNVDLDNFIYTASHDLRAPISNLEGLLQALRQELELPAAEADTTRVLYLMENSIQRFQRTISYLTDITRLQKAHNQAPETVVLADLVEAVRLDLAPQLAASGGQLEVAVSDCVTVAFAEKNLRSIVYNLLSNAFKYHATGRPPRVRVHCYFTDQATVLEVHDNGLGLSPEQQSRLFGMFQRLHDHVEGSGIGLYMVKKIVDNAGGRIEVESQLGIGSVFRVLLPRTPNMSNR